MKEQNSVTTNIYVGNLFFGTTADSLRGVFAQYGEIGIVKIMTDRNTGCARGDAIVEMENETDARTAIDALNGTTLDGRPMYVPTRRSLRRRDTLSLKEEPAS